MITDLDFCSDGFIDPEEAVAANRDLQIELFTNALGLDVVGKIGQGKQGACFLLANGNVFKVSSSYSEGVLAYAQSQLKADILPSISSVYSIEYEEHTFIGFEREEIDDVLPREFDDEKYLFEIVDHALRDTRLRKHLTTDDADKWIDLANTRAPHLMDELRGLLKDLQDFQSRTDILVSDIKLDNVGRKKDGGLVLRDFGLNNLNGPHNPWCLDAQISELPPAVPSMRF